MSTPYITELDTGIHKIANNKTVSNLLSKHTLPPPKKSPEEKTTLLTKFESMTEYVSEEGATSTYPVVIPGISRPVKTVKFCS
jgi:hypothetical protein